MTATQTGPDEPADGETHDEGMGADPLAHDEPVDDEAGGDT
jgi:hypothetical protein